MHAGVLRLRRRAQPRVPRPLRRDVRRDEADRRERQRTEEADSFGRLLDQMEQGLGKGVRTLFSKKGPDSARRAARAAPRPAEIARAARRTQPDVRPPATSRKAPVRPLKAKRPSWRTARATY